MGLTCLDASVLAARPGNLAGSDKALLACPERRVDQAARKVGTDKILDPKGRDVCEMGAWLPKTDTPRWRRRKA